MFQRPLAASAALIFTFYILIAALDSIHFKLTEQDRVGSGEILSVLDLVLWDVKVNVEKTYSAPLAYRSFSKENLQLENGTIVRDYPRLFYGGAHLVDPEKNHLLILAANSDGFNIGGCSLAGGSGDSCRITKVLGGQCC